MFKINRKMEYALISLKNMMSSYPGKLTSAKEICDTYGTPFDPTSRVLQIMAQNGILRAEHGAHGGYQIIRDLSKLSFYELSEMILGRLEVANCLKHSSPGCEITECCNIISPILHLSEKMGDFFKTISIRELVECRHPNEHMVRESNGHRKTIQTVN